MSLYNAGINIADNHVWVHSLSKKQIYIGTFGCAYNEGDSVFLKKILKHKNCTIATNPDDADVIILNTCIVIDKTERKMIKLLRKYSGKERWVTGCLPLARPDLLQDFPDVGIIYPDSIHEAAEDLTINWEGPIQVVQVGPGCTGSCRYCITRCARGIIRSIPPDIIISQIIACEKGGAAEIRLAGQDLSCYGHDTKVLSLSSLLNKVPHLPETCRIRLGMMNPATLLPIARDVAKAMKQGPFFSFLHLPVQSGSDRVLELMGRRYQIADILNIQEIFRSEMPGITIATDIITGFPGETEEDHRKTLEFLEKMKLGMVNVTRYSWRPGTGMGREGELPDRIRKDRSREIIRDAYAMLLEANEKKVGTVMQVITTESLRPGSVMARSLSYEGVVIPEEITPGTLCKVKISGCTPHYLVGTLVGD
ncbi:radical SAM protein [Methanospirillum stamsii]|uniref:tRNA (N(6)-L-threonylcarbamoyladenosine(37)-C(2))-methylthiotransferase n=1 Tax=Methanospirillum stamsii TaxID=1277351 RepID=A0A2V2N1A1_9EURY|nr:radical SAM protein [Methanospirillum stamsii]PWR73539.1 2-methylthioadenine synthetase [Methanospirillum stamsii]